MEIKNSKVLVTGSEGFIGSHLVERLVQLGAEVHCFVLYNSFNSWGWLDTIDPQIKNQIKVISGDVRDEKSVRLAVKGMDIVMHLAALIAIPYSYTAPSSYIDTNIKGTLNVLQAVADFGVSKMIHTSTSETYGTAQYVPIDEKHPMQGQSPYSASKIGADMLAESFYRSFNTPVATIRPFNTYGPRQSTRAVIPTIITQVNKGNNEIKLGSLTPTRDLNYVLDTVEGFVEIAKSDKTIGQVTNIGSGVEIAVGDLAKKIINLMGSNAKITCDEQRLRPNKSEVERLLCDNTKAKELTNWNPKHTLDEGLNATIKWFSKNADKYKADIYNI